MGEISSPVRLAMTGNAPECEFLARAGKDGISVSGGGFSLLLRRPADLETLWQKMEHGEDLPYWVELWPSSLALAEWLLLQRETIRRKTCLDAGCGLGLTVLLGQLLGASVAGIDNCREALVFCRENLRRNGAANVCLVCADWGKPPFMAKSADLIWAADIVYEKNFFQPLLNFFEHCLAPGGKVWIAEPGRCVFYGFLRLARKENWQCRPVHDAWPRSLYPGQPRAKTRIWELARKSRLS